MTKKKMSKEELKKLVLQKAKEGQVVFMTFEGAMSMDLDEIIKQPTEGLLYDLNRLGETVLTFMDDPKWVNDFAVGLVIEKLKSQLSKAHEALAEINKYNPLHNDLESYLLNLAEWGMGINKDRPDPESYGVFGNINSRGV